MPLCVAAALRETHPNAHLVYKTSWVSNKTPTRINDPAMNYYSITITNPSVDKLTWPLIQHMVKARDEEAAIARVQRAYPKAEIEIKQLRLLGPYR